MLLMGPHSISSSATLLRAFPFPIFKQLSSEKCAHTGFDFRIEDMLQALSKI